MIETITYSTTKKYKLPEGCSHFKVTTFGGSGQNGEGKNGGKGGAGEVKTVNVFCKEITIQTRFPKTSEDGKNSFPIVINGEELFEGYFGGKGGNDTCCIIMSGADKLTLYSKGGGGGGVAFKCQVVPGMQWGIPLVTTVNSKDRARCFESPEKDTI